MLPQEGVAFTIKTVIEVHFDDVLSAAQLEELTKIPGRMRGYWTDGRRVEVFNGNLLTPEGARSFVMNALAEGWAKTEYTLEPCGCKGTDPDCPYCKGLGEIEVPKR